MEGRTRSFETELDNLKATELRLGLPGTEKPMKNNRGSKRTLADEERSETNSAESGLETSPPLVVLCRMFISSCKRLRIMKGSEARGLGASS